MESSVKEILPLSLPFMLLLHTLVFLRQGDEIGVTGQEKKKKKPKTMLVPSQKSRPRNIPTELHHFFFSLS